MRKTQMNEQVFIYGLCDPETSELRYVGKCSNIKRRMYDHLERRQLNQPCHRANWLKSLCNKGLRPECFIIEQIPHADWQDAERFWIQYYRAIGCRLTNQTDGGAGGVDRLQQRPEVVERRRLSMIGHAVTLAARLKSSMKQKGKAKSIETRQRMSVSAQRRWASDAARKQMSEMKKSLFLDHEFRARYDAAMKMRDLRMKANIVQ